MSTINIAAITTGAFIGLLALVGIVACVPPITRFLGDLFCCPWRIPFTKKKRLNGDEEVDKEELPYETGEPRPGTSVDDAGYQRTSNAWMSAVSVVDPEMAAKEELRRSKDYRRSYSQSPHRGEDWNRRQPDPYAAQYGNSRDPSPMTEYRWQQEDDAYSGQHLRVPNAHRGRRGHSPAPRTSNYPPQSWHGGEYTPEYYPQEQDLASQSCVDLQPPPMSHAHSPAEMSMHGSGSGYFTPQRSYRYSQDYNPQQQQQHWNRPHRSSEHLMGGRQQWSNV